MFDTRQEIIEWIKLQYGFPLLEIELQDDQLDYLIDLQLKKYSIHKPNTNYEVIELQQGQDIYQLHPQNNETITNVLQIYFPNSFSFINPQLFFTGNKNNLSKGMIEQRTDIVTSIISMEQFKLIVDYLKDRYVVEFIPSNNSIRISPTPNINGKQVIIYSVNVYDISYLDQTGKEWVQKYQLQLSKQIIGRMRSKYSGVQTPLGTISTDGETLLNEQKEEIQQLEEKLKNRREILLNVKLIG